MAYTTNQFHTSQILATNEAPRVTRKASSYIFAGAIALYISTLIPSHPVAKVTSMAIASFLVSISIRLDKLEKVLAPYEAIAHQQSTAAYQQWLNHSMKPPAREVAIATPAEIPAPVKFADIREALKKPHIMVLGETGSGKSVLCKYLASEIKAPCIALDPHASPNDWQGAKVVGQGRNYQAIKDELANLVNLMDARYKQRDKGVSQFATLCVILDEFPAVASELGKDATNAVKLIVREARKVNIKLILLAQGSEVKTLGIEGEGSLRESFAVVSLGKFATDRAKSIKDKNLVEAIAQQKRPAMIDDLPSAIPTISDTVNLPVLPLPRDYLALLTNVADTVEVDFECVDSPSAPVSTSAAPNLSAALSAICEYAKRQDDFVSARKIQSGIRLFRDASVTDIRSYFQWLADKGYGVVRGDLESLEFSVN